MTNQAFPAILIGGPPHSGKSVLIYSLTRALREARISHYVLRACPDGEGDWAYQIPQDLVRAIRVKGSFTPQFIKRVSSYLQNRHLPLLVDVGGLPTAEQEKMFAYCTHAVLLIGNREDDPNAFNRDQQTWQAMMARNGVETLELFRSDLREVERWQQGQPDQFQTLTALERGKEIHGPEFESAVDHLASLMLFPERGLSAIHKRQLPTAVHFIDLPHLAAKLGDRDRHWQPDDLPTLLEQVPSDQPVAVYGRSANWVYASLALASAPSPFTMFDAKLGWVTPPILPRRQPTNQDDWQVTITSNNHNLLLKMNTKSQYLDIDDSDRIPLPPVPQGQGIILSGRIPHWLLVAVCQQLAPTQSWLSVYQPPLGASLVVSSQTSERTVGELIPYQPEAPIK